MADRTLLLRHATVVATMDDARTEIADGAVLIRGDAIAAVGPTAALPDTADEVIDLGGHALLPGFVNTHHHLYQSLTRAVPAAQDASLFDWLSTLYPMWARLTPDMLRVSTLTGDGRTAALRLHDHQRPPVPLPQRQPARRHHRRGRRDRHALPPPAAAR